MLGRVHNVLFEMSVWVGLWVALYGMVYIGVVSFVLTMVEIVRCAWACASIFLGTGSQTFDALSKAIVVVGACWRRVHAAFYSATVHALLSGVMLKCGRSGMTGRLERFVRES